MKRNKRVIASAALSVSLAISAVAPVAWADEMHVKCPQKFRVGSDFDGDVNAKVEEHLQRNCELTTDQISRHSIRDEKFSETTEAGTGGEQQSEPLKVNTVKAGDRQVTGSVFVLPGQQKTIQAIFPNGLTPTQELRLDENSGEGGDASKGKVVPFEIKVPEGLVLKAGHVIVVNPLYGKSDIDVPVRVTVQPADVVEQEGHGSKHPEGSDKPGAGSEGSETPDNGKDKGKEGDNGSTKPGKPQAPGGGADDNPGKPSVPGADDNPGTGKGSLSFGSIFGVIAGLGGVVALVMSVVKFFNQNSDVARFLQPLRNFFSLFKF
ncbi:intracellular motility protein A [Corynebacterium diphtheriae]|uniref:hypothetical protein n=1 Tax=Corynebacterium diphtheriae TaxID=1717 RepID=UPI0002467A30|nr:hypothetical protein [Corynebacterium diphtheriae]AEX76520.1 hypothetical protein CDHC02_1028 [Corynebacterium diphtheriae HC02]MBG9296407.1 intracellular motility protein A [Corynebacterium diphtheriae bv. gravis]UJM22778.1 intracellular motility protein A [Corynebacterium diphtheriae]CAB0694118.1 intracellular motility protein A [Corynebacterium diphtheriae]CAB0796545.1 intracellular motility protein A [Corynebacterium diphtheriae]